ncbi:MAG: DUF1573 domain-containing protein [Bacteroidota bacterium]
MKKMILLTTVLIGLLGTQVTIGQEVLPVKTEKPASESPSTFSSSSFEPASPTVNLPAHMKGDTLAPTVLEWSAESFDFGEIQQGDTVSHTFTFKNLGTQPLRISNIKPSCGCTAPNWTKALVPPGEEGFVEVIFNSTGKSGTQNKSITVFLNTEERRKVLRFKGFIK